MADGFRKSTLRMGAAVNVEIRDRVAVIEVYPLALGFEERRSNTISSELIVGSLSVGLVTSEERGLGQRQRHEHFTLHVDGVELKSNLQPDRSSKRNLAINRVQLDIRKDGLKDVVFASVGHSTFLRASQHCDDVSMVDIHVRTATVCFSSLEVMLTDTAWRQLIRTAKEFSPIGSSLPHQVAISRGNIPYHFIAEEPAPACSKLDIRDLKVNAIRLNVSCRLSLDDADYLPAWAKTVIGFSSFGASHMEVRCVTVELPQQLLFTEQRPGIGSAGPLLSVVGERYLPHVQAQWQALLKDSNLVLGGLLSRHFWNPQEAERRVRAVGNPVCSVHPNTGKLFGESLSMFTPSRGLRESLARGRAITSGSSTQPLAAAPAARQPVWESRRMTGGGRSALVCHFAEFQERQSNT